MSTGVSVFACRRGEQPTGCVEPHCKRNAVTACVRPLTGDKADQVCGRALCGGHATNVGPDAFYCPAHHKEWREERTAT